MKRFLIGAALALVGMSLSPGPSQAGDGRVTFFSETYERETGGPDEWTELIEVPAKVSAPFLLRLENGLADGSRRASSARIEIDQSEILRPQDMSQQTAEVERDVELAAGAHVLTIWLASRPGGRVSLTLLGTGSVGSPPEPPSELHLNAGIGEDGRGNVALGWTASSSEGVAAYRVHRGERPDALVRVAVVAADDATDGAYAYSDHDYRLGQAAFYAVSAVSFAGQEGEPTEPVPAFGADPEALRLPKLGARLNGMYELWKAGADMSRAARHEQVWLSLDSPPRAAVELALTHPPTAEDFAALRDIGVEVSESLRAGNSVYGRLPLDIFPAAQQLTFVDTVSAQPVALVPPVEGTETSLQPQTIFGLFSNFRSIRKLLGLRGVHRQGFKGKGIRIAVVDFEDHGEIVAKIAKKAAPEADVKFLNIVDINQKLDPKDGEALAYFFPAKAFLKAIEVVLDGATGRSDDPVDEAFDVVNMSLGFGPSLNLASTFEDLLARYPNVLAVVSAGNEAENQHTVVNLGVHGATALLDVHGTSPFRVWVYSTVACWSQNGAPMKLQANLLANTPTKNYTLPMQGDTQEVFLERNIDDMPNLTSVAVDVKPYPGDCYDSSGQLLHPQSGPIPVHVLTTSDHVSILQPAPTSECITGMAAAPSALTVGASEADKLPGSPDSVSTYSCRGPAQLPATHQGPATTGLLPTFVTNKPDLVAPGLYERFWSGDFVGTSAAAPWASGAAALLMQNDRRLQKLPAGQAGPHEKEIARFLLLQYAKPLRSGTGNPGDHCGGRFDIHQNDYGCGRLNIVRRHGLFFTDGKTIWMGWIEDGLLRLLEIVTTSWIQALDGEPGTDVVWYTDGYSVVRRTPDGNQAIYHPPEGTDYINDVTCETNDGTCWISTIDGGTDTYSNSKLIQLAYDDGNATLVPKTVEPITVGIEYLWNDPRTYTLWGYATFSRQQRNLYGYPGGVWKHGVTESLGVVFPSWYAKSLAIDPGPDPEDEAPPPPPPNAITAGADTARFVWTHGQPPPGTEFYSIVKLSLDGDLLAHQGTWNDSVTEDFDVDPDTQEPLITHFYGWTRYDQNLSPISQVGVRDSRNWAYRGRLDSVDDSLWTLEETLQGFLLRRFDYTLQETHSQTVGVRWVPRASLFAQLPNRFDEGEPPQALTTAPPEAAPLEETSPLFKALLAAAEKQGVSLARWLRDDPRRRDLLLQALRENRAAREP